jgi:RNA polymerase sigma-70 factor (ECF subfamily)
MAAAKPSPDAGASFGASLDSTATLLAQIRQGDTAARDRLIARYLAPLQRWARGRLPARARDLADTDDLVQVTFLRALDHLDKFEPRRDGAFLAYLRRILQNQIRDQLRRVGRKPRAEALAEDLPVGAASPLEEAIGRETVEVYERALSRLPQDQQEAVLLRIELGFTHREVAEAIGSPSPNAARMLVARALIRLAEVMHER